MTYVLRRLQLTIKSLLVVLACFVLYSTSTGVANAQLNCPTPYALTGGGPLPFGPGITWWAFQTSDVPKGTATAIGMFALTVLPPSAFNPFPQGVLSGWESYNNGGTIVRHAQISGVFTTNATDCSSGNISMNVNSNNYQFKWSVKPPAAPSAAAPFGLPIPLSFPLPGGGAGTMLTLAVNSTDPLNTGDGPTKGEHGTAYLLPGKPTCSGDPLAVLNNTSWNLSETDATQSGLALFTAMELPPSIFSFLAKGALSVNSGGPAFGEYSINPQDPITGIGCDGGVLTINNFYPAPLGAGGSFVTGIEGFQWDFVFAPPYDASGLAKTMLGVDSSNDIPNASGSSRFGNEMIAARTAP